MANLKSSEQWQEFTKDERKRLNEVAYKNEIARCKDKFTVQESKLFHIVVSKLKPHEKNEPIVSLNKSEIFDYLGIGGDDRYRRYRDIVRNLKTKTSLEFKDPISGDEYSGAVIVSSRWNTGKSEVLIGLDPLLMPFLEELADMGRYTTVYLESVLKFNSKHAMKMYQWCKSWSQGFESARYITTQELKTMLDIKNDEYIVNGKFHRSSFEKKTVDRAILEINTKTELRIEYDKLKKHGMVIRYNFRIFDLGKEYIQDMVDFQMKLDVD